MGIEKLVRIPETDVGTSDTDLLNVPEGYELVLRYLELRNTTTSDVVVELEDHDGTAYYTVKSIPVKAGTDVVLTEEELRGVRFFRKFAAKASASGVKLSAVVEVR